MKCVYCIYCSLYTVDLENVNKNSEQKELLRTKEHNKPYNGNIRQKLDILAKVGQDKT